MLGISIGGINLMLKKSKIEPKKIEYKILSNNVVKVFLRENIILESDEYVYNEYSLLINNKENIIADIEENFNIYLSQAKENENSLKKTMKINNLKTSLDNTDYQVIKCVENYMLDSVLPYDFSTLIYERIAWRDKINCIQENLLTEEPSLEQEKERKIMEMMACCQSIISNGIDYNDEHYRLNTTDQINLSTLSALAQQGKSVPYHADGQVCRIYEPSEILGLISKATQFIIYNTTYFNLLKHTILNLESTEEIKAITYSSALPEEYQKVLDSITNQ